MCYGEVGGIEMFSFDIILNSVVMAVSGARGPPVDRYKDTFKCGIFVGEHKFQLSICVGLF